MRILRKTLFLAGNTINIIVRKINKILPEKQLYYRCNGKIHLFVFSPPKQLLLTSFLISILFASIFYIGYSGYKMYSVVHYEHKTNQILKESRTQLARAREKGNNALKKIEENKQDFIYQKNLMDQRLASLEEIVEKITDSKILRHGESIEYIISNPIINLTKNKIDQTLDSKLSLSEISGKKNIDIKLDDRQNHFLNHLGQIVEEKIEISNKIIHIAGVNKKHFFTVQNDGTGGPLITDLPENGQISEKEKTQDPVLRRTKRILDRLKESKKIESIILSMPLLSPVSNSRISSHYGKRRDPFTKKIAFHNGLDFKSSWRAPVLATAPGVVVFSGWRTGYGKIIEIDHGNEFKTRYAHLSKIFVKKGNLVALNQKIGSIGSTGRSTGPHLHYEVWFKGRSYNPKNFLKAGEYAKS